MRPLARTPLACAMTIGLLPPDCRAQALRAVPRRWRALVWYQVAWYLPAVARLGRDKAARIAPAAAG
jgi:hypothetical protein